MYPHVKSTAGWAAFLLTLPWGPYVSDGRVQNRGERSRGERAGSQLPQLGGDTCHVPRGPLGGISSTASRNCKGD